MAFRSIMEWWRARDAASQLHAALSHTPAWSQWQVPCDTNKPDDAIVARAVMLLQQRWPGKYRVVWSKKTLTIYHTEGFEAAVSPAHRELLARWGLVVPPRRDSQGIHAPPPSAGGRQFDVGGEHPGVEPHESSAETRLCVPEVAGGGPRQEE